MQSKLNHLLGQSFSPEHVQLLDELTMSINNNSPSAKQAHEIWRRLKEDDYFWYNADKVLEHSKVNETKVFILVILEQAIKQKWLALPETQRESLKSYIINIVLEYGAQENLPKTMQNILSKADSILVQIVKYEWNTTWNSFINDICTTSLKDTNVCQNNFYILKMLSQQIFDYSKNQMTQKQITELKQHMVQDFTTIYNLCNLVLQNMENTRPSLVKACLETLHAFLSWIPMYYIVFTDLIEKLIYILNSEFLQNSALSCLVEMCSLPIDHNKPEETNKYLLMLKQTTIQLNKILPLTTDSNQIRNIQKGARRKWQTFEFLIRNITLFYSQFFRQQNNWIQQVIQNNQELLEICRGGFSYLVMMMKIDDEQVFKICVQFFHFFIGGYLQKRIRGEEYQQMSYSNSTALNSMYKQIFLQVMRIITYKMAKPEEVLIVLDEDGTPIREQVENTENSGLYEIMRDLATYLVRYDWAEMKRYILEQIKSQTFNENFSFEKLNSFSWVIGSLCGSMLERQEKTFFIASLKVLLQLCESKKGKQSKAIIASCIMYVVGQYPTFLRNSWSFLKTVTRKLFQFMKQPYPGVMEMACNTFLKIVKTTSDQFTICQSNQTSPYIVEIIRKIPEYTSKLPNDTLRFIFYEAIGYLIGAQKQSETQFQYMKQAQGIYLFEFSKIISMAQTNFNVLLQDQVKSKILYFLKINEHLATGIGEQYILILGEIAENINKIYLFYSKEINDSIEKNGKNILNYTTVKSMRNIKKQVIKIYVRYLSKIQQLNQQKAQYILNDFIFPLGNLLQDFYNSLPETKQQQFVALFTLVLEKLYLVISPNFLTNLIDLIFQSSLPLITTDFNSFPEIRANFFAFLKALIKYNFNLLYSLDNQHFNTILDCVIWSIRHQLSTYSDLGLDLLEDILNHVNVSPAIMNAFYTKHYLRILTDILDVMTDGYHKSGIEIQSKVFYILIKVISQNAFVGTISAEQPQGQSNQQCLYNFLVDKLSLAFPHTGKNITVEKVGNWFKITDQSQFKLQIADYLILINRYTEQEIIQVKKEALQSTQISQIV